MQSDDILNFWFDEVGPQGWFRKSDAFDSEIRARFEKFAIDQVARLRMMTIASHPWCQTPDASLALILILDQFPRNMYRDTAAAFAWDSLALELAQNMCDTAWDLKIDMARRAFIYMPFMHSEDLTMQDRCVYLVDSRLDDSGTLHHAKEHRKMIERFGRFPHRNTILQRTHTDAEHEFLQTGGYSP